LKFIHRLAKSQDVESLDELDADMFDEDEDEDEHNLETDLETLRYWTTRHTFNRNKINEDLQAYFNLTDIKKGESK
jgi:hypothetical protein